MPWCACVTAPITHGGQVIGVVSGTNDLSYVDPMALAQSGISPEELNELMQAARVEAVTQSADLYRRRMKSVCPCLENTAVILVGSEQEEVPLEFLVRLVRKKTPRSITVLSRFSANLCQLRDKGEFEAFIAIPTASDVAHVV